MCGWLACPWSLLRGRTACVESTWSSCIALTHVSVEIVVQCVFITRTENTADLRLCAGSISCACRPCRHASSRVCGVAGGARELLLCACFARRTMLYPSVSSSYLAIALAPTVGAPRRRHGRSITLFLSLLSIWVNLLYRAGRPMVLTPGSC